MAEAREIPAGMYDLKLGSTFGDSNDRPTYHTLRYDFKPKSVALENEAYLAFGGNGDVQIAVPGEGDSMTIYKGAQKPVKGGYKDCLLFFDHNTGELRLEKLTSNISVKKTRDTDDVTLGVIRNEIRKLRRNRVSENSEGNDAKSSSGSSSSSSSDSGDSDSDSDSSSEQHPATNSRSHADQNADSSEEEDAVNSGSDDGDDLQDALEQQLKTSSVSVIPNTDSGSSQYQNQPSKLSSYSSSQMPTNDSKKILDSDLHLSDSSDDDDD